MKRRNRTALLFLILPMFFVSYDNVERAGAIGPRKQHTSSDGGDRVLEMILCPPARS
jgi:hypothetical protein